MRVHAISALLAATFLAACGTNQEQRAATGGLTGFAIGALAGGPIGALIGTAVGGGAGALTPIGADEVAFWGRDKLQQATASTPVLRDIAQDRSSPRQEAFEGSGSSDPGRAAAQQRASGKTAPEQSPTRLRVSADTARQLQSTLMEAGLYDGAIDGIVGPQTERGIAAYQQRNGLQDTAVLHWETLQRLTSTPRDAESPRYSFPR